MTESWAGPGNEATLVLVQHFVTCKSHTTEKLDSGEGEGGGGEISLLLNLHMPPGEKKSGKKNFLGLFLKSGKDQ